MPKKRNTSRGYSPRKVKIREVRQTFLIVCEGEKTEPNYFINFRGPKVKIKIQRGEKNPCHVVEKARELKEQEDYDQVWCVFDWLS